MKAPGLIRYLFLALAALALSALGGFVYVQLTSPGGRSGGVAVAPVTIGGPFALTDQNGQPVTEAALLGHPSMIFFGYTNCPDICPVTLLQAPTWLDAVKTEVPNLAFYFVTVDPERDTVETMRSYLASFDPRIVGLTGSPEAIEQVMAGYRVFRRNVPRSDGGYDVDHTAPIYLMNSAGEFEDIIRPEDEDVSALVLGKLRELD